jgi:hypothetical protein
MLFNPWLVQEYLLAIAASEAARLLAYKFSMNLALGIPAPVELQVLI